MLQNATPLRKSTPWPPNISDEHVSCTAPATENASLQILFKCSTPAIVFGNATKPSHFAHFWEGAQSLAPATRNDIWTSKSAPYPSVFCTFDFEICFVPQRRALFRHRNFQKWVQHVVFCTFWLRNVLRATAACTFSTSQLRKVVRTCGVLYILTSKFASCHNGVHFFHIATSKHVVFCTFWLGNLLRATTACNFSSLMWPAGSAPAALASLLFDPRLSYLFAHLHLLSSYSFSSLIFSLLLFPSAFHLPILSEVWLLNFLRSYHLFACRLIRLSYWHSCLLLPLITYFFIYIYIYFVFIYSYDFSFYLNSSSQVHTSPCARRRWVVACWCSLKGKRWGQTDSFGDPAINTLMDYSLVNYITWLWTITIFNREIIYQWSFSIAMLNYQRYMGVS